MKRYFAPVFFLGLLAIILAGCTSTSRIIAAGLEVEITEIVRTGNSSMKVSWRLKNPNVTPYLLSRVVNEIKLNGIVLASIDDKEAVALPAGSNVDRTSSVTGLGSAADHVLTEAARVGSANYHVDAHITMAIYDDSREKAVLTNSGTVTVKAE